LYQEIQPLSHAHHHFTDLIAHQRHAAEQVIAAYREALEHFAGRLDDGLYALEIGRPDIAIETFHSLIDALAAAGYLTKEAAHVQH
jgi:hypothetical protein